MFHNSLYPLSELPDINFDAIFVSGLAAVH